MIKIPQSIVKKIPYVGPVISALGLVFDVKEIVETGTPTGATKTIVGRAIKEYSPFELLITGKCLMLAGGIIATFATTGNPLVVSGTLSAARSILRE